MRSKRVSIFGYGTTTKPLGKFIKNAVYYDDACKEPYFDDNGSIIRPSSEFNPDFSDLEITSPGIPPSNKLIQEAKHLISEYDYFHNVMNFKIWISGTNGKTTTTQMMQHLLEDKGSVAGGNIGTPLAQLDQNAKIWILETSSFTLHYTTYATPNIYVLLPLSADHLSWHGSMQGYVADKLKPIKFLSSADYVILPKKYENYIETKATTFLYETTQDIENLFEIDSSKVKFKGAFLLDALLAMAVDKIMFNRIQYDKINLFEIEPHRQEEILDLKQRLWVNDTKATNLDATIECIKVYSNRYIHLILGGDDKGVDLTPLFLFLQSKKLQIYTIGSNKDKLCELAKKYNIKFQKAKNLQDAVLQIDKNLRDSEVAILSPAAASLDEFDSYAQRGEQFKEVIKTLC